MSMPQQDEGWRTWGSLYERVNRSVPLIVKIAKDINELWTCKERTMAARFCDAGVGGIALDGMKIVRPAEGRVYVSHKGVGDWYMP
jgi:hypothetical protein